MQQERVCDNNEHEHPKLLVVLASLFFGGKKTIPSRVKILEENEELRNKLIADPEFAYKALKPFKCLWSAKTLRKDYTLRTLKTLFSKLNMNIDLGNNDDTAIVTVSVQHKPKSQYSGLAVLKKLKIDQRNFPSLKFVKSPLEADISLYGRQSEKNNKNLGDYVSGFINSLNILESDALIVNKITRKYTPKKVYLHFDQGLSGYYSNLKYFVLNSKCDWMFWNVTRAFRNALEFMDLCQLSWQKGTDLFLNTSNVTQGNSHLLGMIMSSFAEYELSTKQTSFSEEHYELIQAICLQLSYENLSESNQKRYNLIRFVGRESYINYADLKAIRIIKERNDKNKNGNRKHGLKVVREALKIRLFLNKFSLNKLTSELIEEYEKELIRFDDLITNS